MTRPKFLYWFLKRWMAHELQFITDTFIPSHLCISLTLLLREPMLQRKKHIRQFQHLIYMSCSCSRATCSVYMYLPVIRRTSSESSIANSTTASNPVFLFSISSSSWNHKLTHITNKFFRLRPLHEPAQNLLQCTVHLVSAKPEFITCTCNI